MFLIEKHLYVFVWLKIHINCCYVYKSSVVTIASNKYRLYFLQLVETVYYEKVVYFLEIAFFILLTEYIIKSKGFVHCKNSIY